METKYNEATLNRPQGDRIIDAPIIIMDLQKYSHQLKEEEAWKKNGHNGITIFKTSGLTMVLVWLSSESLLKDNLIDGLVTIQVMEGAIDCTVETGTFHLQKQQIISIHPGISHNIRAIEDSLLLITNKAEPGESTK